MPYAYEQTKKQIGFNYADIENPEFLSKLWYVKTKNNRLIYEVRFPNAPIDHEDSLILSLKEGVLKIYEKTEYSDGLVKVNPVDVVSLIQNFPFMGVYDKFVASCFLAQARNLNE